MPSEPCFGPVATCTLLSRSLVSLILVWYATTDSQTLRVLLFEWRVHFGGCSLVSRPRGAVGIVVSLTDCRWWVRE